MTFDLRPDEIVVDQFAGGGGASTGIAWATSREPEIVVNHDAEAIAMHTANHADSTHYIEDVWRVDPEKVCMGRKVGLMWMSPTCFTAGTLVLTSTGLKPIETIRVGEKVLTHKSRWCLVTDTVSKMSDTVIVRGQGHYGLETTPDHPFYSKRVVKRWPRGKKENGKRLGLVREIVENPYWPTAETMFGKLWATPTRFADSVIPTCSSVSFSDDFFYFIGRWLGDGYTNKGDVYICTGADDFSTMSTIFDSRPLLDELGNAIAPRTSALDSPAPKLAWGNATFSRWLDEHFGSGCENKQLPVWVLSLQKSWREALLDGYVDANGSISGDLTATSSVSKTLSVGIRLLVASLGHTPCLYLAAGRYGEIDGRSFFGRDAYKVSWRTSSEKQTAFRDTSHLFTLVKEVSKAEQPNKVVYCLQVDEDASYVADGIVVHNCTHFSKAKGTALDASSLKLRALAWVGVRWAAAVRPRIICLENVEEFAKWGPLHRSHSPDCDSGPCHKKCQLHKPIKSRQGETFRAFIRRLEKLGYEVKWWLKKACDFGAPTTRRRLVLVARCDGQPIVEPMPTHGSGLRPYRTAAECIDWSNLGKSIFDEDGNTRHADKTLDRVRAGIHKYVLGAARPFIVPVAYGARSGDQRTNSVDEPAPTVCGNRGGHSLVTPVLIRSDMHQSNSGCTYSPETPLSTITTGGGHAVIAPYLVHRSNGERLGQTPRTYDAQKPLGTIVAQGQKHAAVAALLVKNNGGVVGQSLTGPIATLDTSNRYAIVASHLVKMRGTSDAHVAASSSSVEDPVPTLSAGGTHMAAVHAFLVRYNGQSGPQAVDGPIGTLDTTDRYGLVTVMVDGEEYVIVDIMMRMLTPRELFLAMGFPPEYVIDLVGSKGKKLSKTAQIRMCGNAVCPQLAEAVVRAQLRPAA